MPREKKIATLKQRHKQALNLTKPSNNRFTLILSKPDAGVAPEFRKNN
jgi:hypothetical protein